MSIRDRSTLDYTRRVSAPDSPRRAGGVVPVIASLEPSTVPLHEQVYCAIRDQIVRRDLRGGVRLASTRALAAELLLSRFTVVTAIERLVAEGYLAARPGSGTFVVDTLPEELMRALGHRRRVSGAAAAARPPALSNRGIALSNVVITGPRQQDGPRAFHPRRPALDMFPLGTWARIVARQWRGARIGELDYGEPGGYRPLRDAIAEHIRVTRGLDCDARQIIVTNGAQQALDVVFRLLLDPGDRVWMEEPGYLDVRAALVAAGASIIPVRVDAHGLDVAHGIARAPDARLAVVSPSHQYPTGATLSASRRAALLDWARRAGAWVVEDDYDSYFRYRGRPVPALQRFDADTAATRRVLYIGTFSKTMFPSLRLGFCVVPEALIDACANARAVASRNSSIVDQAALAMFIREGHYDRHLRRARLIYRERYDALRSAVGRELRGMLSLEPAAAGTHVVARFDSEPASRPRRESAAVRLARLADAAGLVVFPLSRYCVEPPERDGLVLGYGSLTPRQIAASTRKLAQVIGRAGALLPLGHGSR